MTPKQELKLIRKILRNVFNDLVSEDPVKVLAAHIAISCCSHEKWIPVDEKHFTERKSPGDAAQGNEVAS